MSLPLISEFGMKFENLFCGVERDSLKFSGVSSKKIQLNENKSFDDW